MDSEHWKHAAIACHSRNDHYVHGPPLYLQTHTKPFVRVCISLSFLSQDATVHAACACRWVSGRTNFVSRFRLQWVLIFILWIVKRVARTAYAQSPTRGLSKFQKMTRSRVGPSISRAMFKIALEIQKSSYFTNFSVKTKRLVATIVNIYWSKIFEIMLHNIQNVLDSLKWFEDEYFICTILFHQFVLHVLHFWLRIIIALVGRPTGRLLVWWILRQFVLCSMVILLAHRT